jgi:hypothetical protein
MKYSIFIIASLVALLTFTSCEDFLTDEPESVLGQVDFFTTPTRINQGVLGCYAGLKRVMNDEWMFTELRSDNTCVSAVTSSSSRRTELTNLAHFSALPSEVAIQEYWYNTFQNISNINSILPAVLDNTYITVEDDRVQYEAELRFLRANHYFTLVNLFGDMFKVTDVIGPLEAITIDRSPVLDIYNDIIIPDLKIAAETAPSSYTGNDLGRVTKWAAKGLLAKAYMQIGGAENLALAKVLLKEIIDEPTIDLAPNFADIFDPAKEMSADLNGEVIFSVRYLGGDNSNGSPFWQYFAPQYSDLLAAGEPEGNNNPTFELMSLFYQDTAYSAERKEASFDLYYVNPTKFSSYITKYMDPNITVKLNAENDWIVLRYADIKLLYAEILAQESDPDLARDVINEIRDRSGLNPIETTFTSSIMALDSVYAERRMELAFENHRWFDLLRMNTTYSDPNKAMDILKEHTFSTDWVALYSLFNPLPVPSVTNYTNDHLLLPIPQYEIDANTELDIAQNPGY